MVDLLAFASDRVANYQIPDMDVFLSVSGAGRRGAWVEASQEQLARIAMESGIESVRWASSGTPGHDDAFICIFKFRKFHSWPT